MPQYSTGSFIKAGGTQTVPHTLSSKPKALILWTAGKTAEGTPKTADCLYATGITDGTTSRSVAHGVQDGQPIDASGRHANKLLTIVQWSEVLLAECDFVSWSATGFTIDWTTDDGQPYYIYFLAVGGNDVLATVKEWNAPAGPGNVSITGIGFKPAALIHLHNLRLGTAPPYTEAGGGIGLGFETPSRHAAVYNRSVDGATSSGHLGYELPSHAITLIGTGNVAKAVSFDTDGFTMEFTNLDAEGANHWVFTLALGGSGMSAEVGNFAHPGGTGAVDQPITGVGFQPGALLHFHGATTIGTGWAHFSIGASESARNVCAERAMTDFATTATAFALSKSDKCILWDGLGNRAVTQIFRSEAYVLSFDTDGFTIRWDIYSLTNSSRQNFFLALGPITLPPLVGGGYVWVD